MICPECGIRLPIGRSKCHFCGNEISHVIETRFIDKFIALFALIAFLIAASVAFYTFLQTIQPNDNRVILSVITACILTFIYWVISPLAIKHLIDPLIKN